MAYRQAFDVVQRIAAEFPPRGRPLAFTHKVAAALAAEDEGWGLNGKRGGDEISTDVVHFRGTRPSDPAMQLVDILRDADGVAEPQWIALDGPANFGKWIPVRGAPPPPLPTPPPSGDLEARVTALEREVRAFNATVSRVLLALADNIQRLIVAR